MFAGLALAALGACAAPTLPANPEDPFEERNRKVHAFNKELDRVALRPASQVYGAVIPAPLRGSVSNFAANLSLPSDILNYALQGNLVSAADSTGRFLVNSTFGLAGFFDPATALGTPVDSTDFGETLHVWGAGEGAYLERPVFGPATARDFAGGLVDLVINPVGQILDAPEINYARGTRVASTLDTRFTFSNTIDSVLYDSADSYAQARLAYLQRRRFELGQTVESAPSDFQDDLYDDLFIE
ncbi:MAG: VacJ family lipoprotein [Cyanobacteria bacterium P01_D01_bin.128]